MTDVIVIAVVLAIVFVAARYVINAKKSGKTCIGCPDGTCPSRSGKASSCNCGITDNR